MDRNKDISIERNLLGRYRQEVKQAYGNDIDVKLLWKFAGAVDGIHWKLIQEPRKRQLLENCN